MSQRTHLGDLEQAIMDVLWKQSTASVRDVVAALKPKRPLAYTTVMTVMNRLVEKNLLKRQANGASFKYTPVHTKPAYMARASKQAIDQLIASYGSVAIATFLDQLDGVDPQLLARLKARYATGANSNERE